MLCYNDTRSVIKMAIRENRFRLREQVSFFHAYHYFLQEKVVS